MNHLWLNQTVDYSDHWRQHLWYSTSPDYSLGLNWPDLDLLLQSSSKTFKNDQTTTVAIANIGQNTVVVKRYNCRSVVHKFKRAFRRSRARRCWDMSYRFQAAGLNVAQPIIMCEKRFGPIRRDAYFVNLFLHGEELISLLPSLNDEQLQAVLSSLQSAFKIMQKNKLSHGDMKASNLLWVGGQLVFIDLDAAQQHTNQYSWAFAHKKDKKRFLKNWQDSPKLLSLFAQL